MKIGVSGASGKLGGVIVSELIERGGDVVAVSRSADQIEGDCEKRVGDYDQPQTLPAAYAGLDRLVLIPTSNMQPGVRGAQIKAAIDAAVKAGVDHVTLLSAAGTREASVPAFGESYWTAEQHLIRTAPHWTILRMNYYAQSMIDEIRMSQQQGALVGLSDTGASYVSRDDVGAATAGALATDGHSGAIYNLTGPAVLTGRELAALASTALGKSINFAIVSEEELRGGLSQAGLPELVVNAVVGIKRSFADGHFDILTGDVERLSGRAPKAFLNVFATYKP